MVFFEHSKMMALGKFCLILALSAASIAVAQDQRADLVDEYQSFYTGQRPIYQAAPVTHVVPEFNTVTYVIDARQLNTEVTPKAKDNFSPASDAVMKVTGYRVSPYLALSLKRVGLGFNVEAGQSDIGYSETIGNNSSSQKSSVSYRGLGIYGFFKVFDGKVYDLTLIAGGRSTNARHIISPMSSTWRGTTVSQESSTYRYTVNTYEAGLNNQFHLLESVTLTPWLNYAHCDDANGSAQLTDNDPNATLMREDLRVFWESRRTIDYGIDLGIRISGFEVRIGGLLGLVFSSAGGSDQVKDNGYSLSFTFHHKG